MTASPSKPTLLVPMHADNWALALASGYVGPSLRSDPAVDIQNLAGGSVLAFPGDVVPAWAINYGEGGPRVLLEVEATSNAQDGPGGVVLLPDIVRATRITLVRFADEEQQRNFVTSYSLFPDVPVALVPSVIGGFSIDSTAHQVPKIDGTPIDIEARRAIEYFAGWVGGLFDELLAGKHEAAIRQHLRQPGDKPAALGSSLLQSLHSSASALDRAIWGTVIEVLSERAAAHGFDKSEVLQQVAQRLEESRVEDLEGAQAWISICTKVVRASIDPPPLDDQRHIGQRAALAALLSPDPRSAASLAETLGAGPIVQSLAMVAARAFDGLSRLDSSRKNTVARLDAILTTAEAITLGSGVDASFTPRRFTQSFGSRDALLIDGKEAFTRELEPRSYGPLLSARAAEAGIKLQIDPDQGGIYFVPSTKNNLKIFVEEDPASTESDPIVRFLIPLGIIGARSGSKLQAYLNAAWKTGCAVGVRDTVEGRLACAFASQPTATLDRDEFSFHVSRLLAFTASMGTKRKRSVKAPPKD
ncbi:hypothetical protein [Bradyrhizobium sp. AUGA SZCCT0283]|uniref:hypothetical protein n=1 Tax=Bradyrhizobium sp. AUGA SZCCT0283 TaxID=2807671 RepID=UPI001BA6B33E|nr:hypothetical protein [Bradyrhizobium sp. AUGA SZCCT0283]MBR1274280.1 hypothetical protein [Bradyrhizobium sp. AUGA SZCCT0283]